MNRDRLDNLITLVSGKLAPIGFDCIEAEWLGHDRILRLYVDKLPLADGAPATAINLDDCVVATRALNEDPELDAAVSGAYTLEISSPGIERPLRRAPCFARHVGSRVQVKLRTKKDGRWQGQGTIADVAGDEITLDTAEGPWSFPLENLQKASLVYDWDGVLA